MAWWKPEEEPSPQSRIGASGRVGATSRPVEDGEAAAPPYPAAPPAHPAAPSAHPAAPPAHPPLPRRRFPVSLPVAILALVFVAAIVLPFVAVFGGLSGDDRVTGFDSPASHDGPSLVARERFEKALARIRKEAGSEASLTVLRVEPKRIDAVMTTARRERVNIQVLPDLDVRRFGAGGSGERGGLSLGRIDPAVPERLVRAGAERLRAGRGDLSYMALTSIPTVGGGGVWSVFFSSGRGSRYVIADLDGSNIRVPGQ